MSNEPSKERDFLSVGGQAILRGVMMRSPKYFAVACRAPNDEIIVHGEPLEKTWIGRQKWLKVPFLRGTWALLDAMTLGARAMKFASDVQMRPDLQTEEDKAKLAAENANQAKSGKNAGKAQKIQDGVIVGTLIVSLAISLFIFKYIPHAAGTALERSKLLRGWQVNLVIEAVKFALFIGYMLLIRRLPEILSVFRYHGAEHKAINVYERDLELTMGNCQTMTRLHPRCGTSFAMIVLILGFFVFPFVPRVLTQAPTVVTISANFLLHLALLPFIAGIAYELLRFAGKQRDNARIMWLFKPGIWTQYITTEEPTEVEIEVAIASLKACLEGEASMQAAETSPA